MSKELTLNGVRVLLRGDGPFRADTASVKGNLGWPFWIVVNDVGLNCLAFPDKPGAVLTDRAFAEAIARAAE